MANAQDPQRQRCVTHWIVSDILAQRNEIALEYSVFNFATSLCPRTFSAACAWLPKTPLEVGTKRTKSFRCSQHSAKYYLDFLRSCAPSASSAIPRRRFAGASCVITQISKMASLPLWKKIPTEDITALLSILHPW